MIEADGVALGGGAGRAGASPGRPPALGSTGERNALWAAPAGNLAVQQLLRSGAIQPKLADTMNRCISCHADYQLPALGLAKE